MKKRRYELSQEKKEALHRDVEYSIFVTTENVMRKTGLSRNFCRRLVVDDMLKRFPKPVQAQES